MNYRFLAFIFLPFYLSINNLLANDFQKELKTKLINAHPGDTIYIPSGFYHLDTQMSLLVENVTIKGAGMDKTILSFAQQKDGAEGFYVSANNFTIEDLSILDTSGDGIKINESLNVIVRRVKVEWTHGPKMENGGYGFYPVLCQNVLIEDSVAIGASDSGIYVGQSKNIIVRRNKAYLNVAGIEIENSIDADVYENEVFQNTGGILVFNMPDLSQAGSKTRIFDNIITDNNTINFSPAKNTVADLPTGTGIMITANKQVEIFNNLIHHHGTTNILVVSYAITGRPINDEAYNPYAKGVYILQNDLQDSGYNPQGGSSEFTQILVEILKSNLPVPFPHIIFDGSIDPQSTDSSDNLCIVDELIKSVPNLFINISAPSEFKDFSYDPFPHACTHKRLNPIVLPN